MVLRQALERPQRAALELHEAFAFAGTPKLCPRADALLCKQRAKNQGNEKPKGSPPGCDTPLPSRWWSMYVQALDLDLARVPAKQPRSPGENSTPLNLNSPSPCIRKMDIMKEATHWWL